MTPFVGAILPFAGNYAPDGWHLCDGSLLSINTYQVLFSLIGTTYGGDGVSTFGIPDLRSRIPLGAYMGGVGDNYPLASKAGQNYTVLTMANMPLHGHTAPLTSATGTYKVSSVGANSASPTNAKLGTGATSYSPYTTTAPSVTVASATVNASVPVSVLGNTTQVVPSLPPYTVINFILALEGLYPQRAN